jgi:protein required for attachment to host cells
MLNPKDRYWVVVADSGRARILEMRRKPYAFRLVTDYDSVARHRTSKELVSDAAGRVYNTQGPGTHAMQPRSDPHQAAEEQFAHDLALRVGKAAGEGRFDRLALIADARTLGRLRRDLGKDVSGRVVEERSLDLTGLSLHDLEPRVRNILGWAA